MPREGIIADMSESSSHTLETTPVAPTTVAAAKPKSPNRLYQAAAWVAIVAGTLFIIAVIFFTGFVLGKHSDGPGRFDRHRGNFIMERHGGPPGGPGMHRGGRPMMLPGGPGTEPGGPGPGNPGPGQPPTR